MNELEDFNSTERYFMHLATQNKIPINGSIELLPLCNLDCKMCYVHLTKNQMDQIGRLKTLEEWIEVGKQMKEAGTLYLLLTGGEPLLYPQFKELYLALQDMGMIITINTNGTLIDEKWADFFAKHRPRRINITVYGKDNDTYQQLCNHPKGFDLVCKAIGLLVERNVDVKLSSSLTKYNEDSFLDIAKLSHQFNVPMTVDGYMLPATRERGYSNTKEVRSEPKKAAKVFLDTAKFLMGEETFKQYAMMNIQKVNDYQPNEIPLSLCHAGKCSFTINWQGYMRPCVILSQPEYNVFEMSFLDAWNKINEYVSQIVLSSKCNKCRLKPMCANCMASALIETAHYEGSPEYLCEYTNEQYKILKEYLNDQEI